MATAPDANPGNGAVVEGGFTMLGGAGDDLPSYEEALTHPTHISASPSQSYPNTVAPLYPGIPQPGENSLPLYPNLQPSAPPANSAYPQPVPAGHPGFAPPPFIPQPTYPPCAQFAYGYNTSHVYEELTDDLILSVFEKFATKKSWFFNRPKNLKQNVKIQKKELEFRLRYTLQTYVEKRKLQTRTEKIVGHHHGAINSVPIGDLWSYELRPNQLWWEGTKDRVLQHTVDRCQVCVGSGKEPCTHCSGTGKVECTLGFHDGNPPCHQCHDTRLKSCQWCRGLGQSNCSECGGKGVLRVIVSVVAEFSIKTDHHFDGPGLGVPFKKMHSTQGNELLSLESNPPILMLPPYPLSPTLNEHSSELLNKHYSKYVTGNTAEARAIRQRHDVTSIPITYVEAVYKGKVYHLWLYGKTNSVHCPDFSSCSIL